MTAPTRHRPPGDATPGPGPDPATAGGLARRAPAAPPSGTRPPVDDALLGALSRYARSSARGGPAARGMGPAAGAFPGPAPVRASTPARGGGLDAGESPFAPPDALVRRVKGAQVPRTSVVGLRSGRPQPEARPSRTLMPGPSKATDVRTLLTSFTAGVQRGLAEAERDRRSAPPGIGTTPPGDRS
jgi:hypothetical protein